jgi:hypothetical protein
MRGLFKAGFAVGLAVLLAALLAVLASGASSRGREAHCRNNLRQLGQIAAGNWDPLEPPAQTGRAFWQQVREAQYRDVKGKWRTMNPDPFVCPVHGKTESKPDDPSRIDYRGPRRPAKDPKEFSARPLGADRPGNHPGGGGYVLRLDGSTASLAPRVDAAGPGDPLWADADRELSD